MKDDTVNIAPMKRLVPARRPGETIEQAIERIAARAIENAPPELRKYDCPDCQDRIFIMVPCSDAKCLCARVPGWSSGHMVARECLSCDAGIAVLAGRWFAFVYRRDRSGRFQASKDRDGRFEAFLETQAAGARIRIREAMEVIVRREKAQEAPE